MFCNRTARDTPRIFSTDNEHFGLVSICEHCLKEANKILSAEEAKEIKFRPQGAPK